MTSLHHRQNQRQRMIPCWRSLVALLVGLSLIPLACTRSPDADAEDSTGGADVRIVSFSPALSRMLVDLGLEDKIGGRTPYCRFLDQSVTVVGDLHRVDYERLIDLDPTHVLIQAPADGADRRLLELCTEHDWIRGQWSRINRIEDIEKVLRELPGVLFEPGSSEFESASGRVVELLNEIALALSPGGDALWRGDILIVHSADPISVFGRDTYLNDVLVRLGASNAITSDGWMNLTLEDVAMLDPPAIVMIDPDAPADVDITEGLGAIGGLDIAAVRDNRLAVLRAPGAMLPSTGIIEAAREFRQILRTWATDQSDQDQGDDAS